VEVVSLVNLTLELGIVVLIVIGVGITIEVYRLATAGRRKRRVAMGPPRRSPHLERRIAEAFRGPREAYGDVFAGFSVMRVADTTQMDVATKGPWQTLNLFTRSLIVRHLWRSLEKLARNTVTVRVDPGAPGSMLWTAKQTAEFNDGGKMEPWAPARGKAGTLISGS
jgi:hypothetical protein